VSEEDGRGFRNSSKQLPRQHPARANTENKKDEQPANAPGEDGYGLSASFPDAGFKFRRRRGHGWTERMGLEEVDGVETGG
jgi:hypothetical protein